MPVENQRYYLGKGAVFLAIKIKKLAGAAAEIKPLHITYNADRLSLPLKFSSHSGVFDVQLYTLTKYLPYPDMLNASRLEGQSYGEYDGIAEKVKAPTLFALIGNRHGYITRFAGYRLNDRGRQVQDMAADPTLPLAPALSERTGSGTWPVLWLLAGVLLGWMAGRLRRSRPPTAPPASATPPATSGASTMREC